MTSRISSHCHSYILAFLLLFVLLFSAPIFCANRANNNNQADRLDFPVTRLSDRLHIIYGPLELPNKTNRGFRNNPLIILTNEGVVICDPGGSASAGQMVVKKVKEITHKPIVAVFISHAHGDHWLGNEAIKNFYPAAVIYGHVNMKSKLVEGDGERWLDMINRVTEGTANGKRVILPDITVENGQVINIGDISFRMHHTGIAHTEGDIMIEIVEENAVYLGDVVRNEFLGIMEEDSSFEGNIAAINYMLEQKNFDYYIPGHGRVGNKDMLKSYHAYLSTIYNNVKMLYSTGLADYEMKPQIVKSLNTFKNWTDFDIRVGAHISRAYLEVEAESF